MSQQRRMTAALLVVTCLCMNFMLQAQELRKEGRYWVGEIDKTFKVKDTGTLIMEDVQGDIIIQTWDKKEVKIHEIKKMDIFTKTEAEAAMSESQNGYQQNGDIIEISGPAFERSWIKSKFNITIPENFDCDLETKGGDIDAMGVKGNLKGSTGGGDIKLKDSAGTIDTKTGGGDITVENSEGEVRASTGGGDVTVSKTKSKVQVSTGGGDVSITETQDGVSISTGGGDIQIRNAGGDVSTTTGGGDIDIQNIDGNFKATTGGGEIKGRTIKGKLSITTGGGDIDLSDIRGAIDVTTGGGDVDAEMTLTDFSVDHHIRITCGGGEVTLTLPEKIPATVDAEIKYNERTWEDYDITSDFPLNITVDEESSRYRIIRGTGDLNGGGDLIKIKTGGGNIKIEKLQ